MKIRFWGTCGSLPTPLRPDEVEEKIYQAILQLPDISTADPQAVRAYVQGLPPLLRGTAGGNTPCMEIQAGGETLVVDAGSGLRELGLTLLDGPLGLGQGTVHIFISHTHWDHIQGFPMFRPALIPGNHIFIYGVHDLRTAFEQQQQGLYWPIPFSEMRATIEFVPLKPGQPLAIGTVRVNIIQNSHPGTSYGYRFEDQHSAVVYACDAEYQHLDAASLQPYIDFFRNADALIFDAQYTLREAWQKVDWGHSSALIGVDLARAARVKKLVLSHHEPTHSDADLLKIQATAMDYQAQDPTRPICEVIVAHEGLTLDLTPLGAVDLQFTPDGEAAILTPLHIFDQYGGDQLARQLARLAEQNASSIIDLSQVETLTTAGLRSLVMLRQARGTPIVLVTPADSVRRVIELSGYLDCFALYPSLQAALQAVQAREALNLPGQLVQGRYQIESKLGESPLGTVLKATDTQTSRTVALKVLSPALSRETLDRFLRQDRQIMALDHRNIVRVLSWERCADHFFQVEEYVPEETLQQLLNSSTPPPDGSPLSNDRAMVIALEVATALEYAHSRGVIHGDLKPQNVFLTESGVKLSGFGQGRLEECRDLLETPLLFLTASYLAPEQILGQALDARTDLYALGVMLYQLFTGRLPFVGTDAQVLQAHLHQEPRPPRALNPLLSPSLEHLILKLLAKNPNDRYASAQQIRSIFGSLVSRAEETTYQQAPLVGRAQQLQALQSIWREAQAGRGQLVFITGESGIGKTSLARQAAVQSRAPVQLAGQGQEHSGNPAYYLFSQVLEGYFNSAPPEFLDDQARQLCANLTHLVPHIRQMLPGLPDPVPLEPEHEQLRLMSSLTQFVGRATRERPWFLILDDLQWADTSSLELLRYLGRHLPSMTLMVVGIYRDAELERGHPLLKTLDDLSRHPTYHQFPMDCLGQDDVGQLLANIWRQAVPAALVERIYQHTAGNPFYVEEVAKGLVDDGLITLQEGKWQFPTLEDVCLPPSVREAVWKRIGHLTVEVQALLSQAAVLGATFRFDDLREMSGLPEWQVLEHLDIVLERQLVQEVPGDTLLRFRHPEIRDVLYNDLGPLRRRMLHRQAGEALERRAQKEHIAAELAYHLAEAGEFARAVTYSIQVARQAQESYANEAALLWYNRTLEMLDRLGADSTASSELLRLLAHQSLGEVLTLVGRYEEALAHCTAARTLLEALTPPPDQARPMAALCHQTAQVYEKRGEYDLALTWLEKGLRFLDENEPTIELVRLYNLSGWVRRHQGLYEVARTWLERAMHLAQAGHLRQAEADSLRRLGAVSYYLGDYQKYRTCSEQALHIFREIGDRRGEGAALNNLGILFITQGAFAEARAYQEQSLLIWREIGDRQAESVSLNNLGELAMFLGDYTAAKSCYEQSLHICHEIGDRRGQGRALSSLGVVAAGQGDYARARAHYEEALSIRREIGDLRGEGETAHNQGTLSRYLGDYARARANYEQALLIYREIGDRLGETMGLCNLGLLLHQVGEDEAAREYCQQALQLAQNVGDRHFLGYAWTDLGHALAGLGHLAESAAAYEQALAQRQEIGELHLAVEARAGLARVTLAGGDLVQAQSQVEAILCFLETAAPSAKGSQERPGSLGPLAGTDEPFRVYTTCYQVLRAGQDPRAGEVLRTACQLLQELAAAIGDEQLRRSFLENVAAHREIRSEGTKV